jgi:nitroreductase
MQEAKNMNKVANTDYPIHDLLKNRWSPRAFSTQPVEPEKLWSLFEAARWAPSSGNLQPWSFIVTSQADFGSNEKLLGTLAKSNQEWAKSAPILVLAIARREREPDKPNIWATYDLGQAVAHLSVQASAMGLSIRQIGGFDRGKAGELFELPVGFDPITVIAIGYSGDPIILPDGLREQELGTRARRPLLEFVFSGAWKESLIDKERSLLK